MRKSFEAPVGSVFGEWTVLAVVSGRSHATVRVRCSCGTEQECRVVHLVSGKSTRCQPCSFKARQKSYTPEYEAWLALIQRCA
jgi:hypothetical protein